MTVQLHYMCRHYIQGIPVPLTLSYPQTQQSFYSHCMLIPSSPSVPSTLSHPSLVFPASLTRFLLLFLTHYRPPSPFILLLPLLLIPPFPLLSSQDTKSKPRPLKWTAVNHKTPHVEHSQLDLESRGQEILPACCDCVYKHWLVIV